MTADSGDEGVKERVTLPEDACLLREVEQRSVSAEMAMKVHFQQQSVLLAQGQQLRVGSQVSDRPWRLPGIIILIVPRRKAATVAVGKVTSG